jgi:hypothetical protein
MGLFSASLNIYTPGDTGAVAILLTRFLRMP